MSPSRLALLAAVAVLAASCERPFESETVARVGDHAISEEDVERTVEHYEEEFAREGREFPERDSRAYEQLERTALGLLVFREQLEQAAENFGIDLSEKEVERRVEIAREAEGDEEEAEGFFEGAVRTQMIREAVARRLFRDLVVSEADVQTAARARGRRPNAALRRELLQERRNAALARWVADARRTITVEYEPGWEANEVEGAARPGGPLPPPAQQPAVVVVWPSA